MTWGMHAIGHLELGQEEEASMMFDRSYLPYVQVPNQPSELFYFDILYSPASLLHVDRGARRRRGSQLHHRDGRLPSGKLKLRLQSIEKHNIQAVLYGYIGVRAHIDHMEVSTFLPSHALALFITINFTACA